MEDLHPVERGRHIGALGHGDAAIGHQRAGLLLIQLVLRCTG